MGDGLRPVGLAGTHLLGSDFRGRVALQAADRVHELTLDSSVLHESVGGPELTISLRRGVIPSGARWSRLVRRWSVLGCQCAHDHSIRLLVCVLI
jgi:hypothetical protein